MRKHAKVSERNPSLVLFVIDISKSMKESGQLRHIYSAIKPLKSIAESKRNQIRFVVISFDTACEELFSGKMERAPSDFDTKNSFDTRTNLKNAAKHANRQYRKHLEHCKDKNPLASILFFTDGDHTPGVDRTYSESGAEVFNEWSEVSVDECLSLAEYENVVVGLIDYSGSRKQFPDPQEEQPRKNKLTKLTVLDQNMVSGAYARDISSPSPVGENIEEIFGPQERLIGKRFIVNSSNIDKSPRQTSAFVKLGTFTSTLSGESFDESFVEGIVYEEFDL